MLPQNNPDRIRIIFDDHRLVANAGLLLPATLAQHLGLAELVRQCLDLGNAPGRANTGDKIMTLVASALAGGDCIDDADALRTGGTACTLGSTVKAPSTLGTFLRSFRWGHVRQLDRVQPAVAGPGLGRRGGTRRRAVHHRPRSTICETYGLTKEGAPPRLHRHPWLSPAVGHCRRHWRRTDGPATRERRANNTTRGARETVGRVRYAGARGQLTVRADSGFYAHAIVAVCRKMDVRYSITIRQHKSLRHLIEAIPETDWTPIPYWMDGAADVAETTYTPFESEAHARFPTGPLRYLQLSRLHHRPGRGDPGTGGRHRRHDSYHGFITDRDGETLELEADIAATTAITASSPTGTGRPWNWRPTSPPRQLSRLHHRPGRGDPGTGGRHRRHDSYHGFITDRDGETLELEADIAATTAITASSPTGTGRPWNWRPTSPPRQLSRLHHRPGRGDPGTGGRHRRHDSYHGFITDRDGETLELEADIAATTAITASSPTGTGRPWNWRPTSPPRSRSRMPSATSSTASV